MNVEELKDWIINNDIEKRTMEGFWLAFNNYMEEYPEEFESYFGAFNKHILDVKIQQIALMLSNYPVCDPIHVISYIPIIYRAKTVGLFRLLFTLDGRMYDDYFTLD